MRLSFQRYWQQLRESLWFVPGLLVLSAFGLAYGLIKFDSNTSFNGAKRFPLLFGVSAEGSRGMLTAIASSMLTVAALVFSLTLTSISQVSSQYSPRVLRNFMRDRSSQVVMGYFVGVFAYCLLVLGTIRGTEEQKFVPSTAVLVGLILALGGVVALIFFVHHIAESLQTGTILQQISRETLSAIDKLFPASIGQAAPVAAGTIAAWQAKQPSRPWQPVLSTQSGYVQSIDTQGLLTWAVRHKLEVRIEQLMGAFVGENGLLFSVRPDPQATQLPDDKLLQELLARVTIGRHRNIEQDVAFGVQQLVDIALKALGINDTTTAIMTVDHLAVVGQRLAERPFPPLLRTQEQHPRVLAQALDFTDYVRLAFDLIRLNAKGDHMVFRQLLRALALIASTVHTIDRKSVLREQAELLLDYADQTLATDYEKHAVQALYLELRAVWQ